MHVDVQVDPILHWSQRSCSPKSVFQMASFCPPKLGSFPCSLNIFTNDALCSKIIGCSLVPQKTRVTPFTYRACNMGLNKAPYEKVPDSTWLSPVWPHKWVGHGHLFNIIYIIIVFLINMQFQGQHPHQWAPFQIAGLLHTWQISHQISRYVYHEG